MVGGKVYRGISVFASYWIQADGVRRKRLDCKCERCLYFDSDGCKNTAFTGEWSTKKYFPNEDPSKRTMVFDEVPGKPWRVNTALFNYLGHKGTAEYLRLDRAATLTERDRQLMGDFTAERHAGIWREICDEIPLVIPYF